MRIFFTKQVNVNCHNCKWTELRKLKDGNHVTIGVFCKHKDNNGSLQVYSNEMCKDHIPKKGRRRIRTVRVL